mmetsp:Transcript_11611/g.24502  ORF Transcript_11611/g.24502 Transcript_11611/m.24502 type:complete len:409 (+) Transcript_11611:943-2169(+)
MGLVSHRVASTGHAIGSETQVVSLVLVWEVVADRDGQGLAARNVGKGCRRAAAAIAATRLGVRARGHGDESRCVQKGNDRAVPLEGSHSIVDAETGKGPAPHHGIVHGGPFVDGIGKVFDRNRNFNCSAAVAAIDGSAIRIAAVGSTRSARTRTIAAASVRRNGSNLQIDRSLDAFSPDTDRVQIFERGFVGTILLVVVAGDDGVPGSGVPHVGERVKGELDLLEFVFVFVFVRTAIGIAIAIAIGTSTACPQRHVGLESVGVRKGTGGPLVAKTDPESPVGRRRRLHHQLQSLAGGNVGPRRCFRFGLDESGCVQKGNDLDRSVKDSHLLVRVDRKGSGRFSSHDGIVHFLPLVPRICKVFQHDQITASVYVLAAFRGYSFGAGWIRPKHQRQSNQQRRHNHVHFSQ